MANRIAKCRDCGLYQKTYAKQFFRAAKPRCTKCGGMLDYLHITTYRKNSTYRSRNQLLKELGFTSYQEYLDSPIWQEIKQKAFSVHGRNCRVCGKPAITFHHLGYGWRVLTGVDLKPLVPICNSCHYKIEHKGDGSKRTLVQAHTAYSRFFKKRKKAKSKCLKCGGKAKKKSKYCRPCLNEMRQAARIFWTPLSPKVPVYLF